MADELKCDRWQGTGQRHWSMGTMAGIAVCPKCNGGGILHNPFQVLVAVPEQQSPGERETISLSDLTFAEVYSGVPVKDIQSILESLAQRGYRVVKG